MEKAIERRQGDCCHHFNIVLEVLADEKNKICMNIGKEETKLLLFEDDIAIYIEYPENLQTSVISKGVQKNCCIKDQHAKNNSIPICH